MDENDPFLEGLLHEDEGPTLDFKREQYTCTTNEEKGELIKDILAFTNAWRHADAFILIGVEENPGRRAQVVGVTHHLKDANLQQLVNSKTDQPLDFSYRSERLDGKDIGILHIPVQNRPRFITKPFGKLEADTVYLRRGSSTAIARPDEVAKMGTARVPQPSPNLQVQFANVVGRILEGDSVAVQGTYVDVTDVDATPDFQGPRAVWGPPANREYFRRLVFHEWAQLLCSPIQFAIINSGSVPATDVRVELSVQSPRAVIFDEYSWPEKPEEYPTYNTSIVRNLRSIRAKDTGDIEVDELTNGTRIVKITINKVQPMQTAWIDSSLFLGAKSSGVIPLNGAIWADNLSSPQTAVLAVDFATRTRRMPWKQLLEEATIECEKQLVR